MTRPSFETALKKGEAGEMLIKAHLENNGWTVYRPVTDGAHCFDMLSIKGKKTAIAIDVKAKARMNKWPATGIDQRHFDEYQHFSQKHSMPFWVIFVDEALKKIYGNCIEELEKCRCVDGVNYPWVMPTSGGKKIRVWPLEAMKVIASISDFDATVLQGFNQRNHSFNVANQSRSAA